MPSSNRIVFLILSAVHAEKAVDQLAAALSPHLVLVHHDFSQRPEFRLQSPNVSFVPEPKRTGWGTWGFTEAILHSLEFASRQHDFDYLQVLSPTCLPIKPLSAFKAHVAGSDQDAHFGAISLLDDRDALMSVGYRAFSRRDTFRFRALRYLSRKYFSETPTERALAGVWLKSGTATGAGGAPTLLARLALAAVNVSSHPGIGRHVFDATLRPYFGSVWFGARRSVLARLTELAADDRLRGWFRDVQLPEEFLFPSLLVRASERPGRLNHLINSFDQANPRWLTDADFSRLARSEAFFARKFLDDPSAALRLRVLSELVRAPASQVGCGTNGSIASPGIGGDPADAPGKRLTA
jgi:hypothetical protein